MALHRDWLSTGLIQRGAARLVHEIDQWLSSRYKRAMDLLPQNTKKFMQSLRVIHVLLFYQVFIE